MKILDIETRTVTVPLITTFKTALREVNSIENVLVTIRTDTREVGLGGAAPTAVMTGETISSITGAVEHIRETLKGMDIEDTEQIFQSLNRCIVGNFSAKAAVDMAVWDLWAKSLNVPLFNLLGGWTNDLFTDMTVSLGSLEKMTAESCEKVNQGFDTLKIKVGNDPDLDILRLEAIRAAVGPKIKIRIDANQGWTPKEAVRVGEALVKKKIDIELMEQPVQARDFKGMRFVREKIPFPVFADESVFSPGDALELVAMEAVDGLNIKLMKCGGIYNALKIANIAETAGLPCMIGSMMETAVSVTAAAHLATSRRVIQSYDLDAPLFCSVNPAQGGMGYKRSEIILSQKPGLGIEKFL